MRVHTLHGVGFARRCLPVGENGPVEAIEHGLKHRPSRQVVDILLRARLIEHMVESKIGPLFASERIFTVECDSFSIN